MEDNKPDFYKSPEGILQMHFEAKGYVFDHFKNWLDFRVHLPTIYAAMAAHTAVHIHSYKRELEERDKEIERLKAHIENLDDRIEFITSNRLTPE
jgi:prefoldin subunit 5